jgi:hypothetical protein
MISVNINILPEWTLDKRPFLHYNPNASSLPHFVRKVGGGMTGEKKTWSKRESEKESESGREEKILNDETDCAVKWLD